MPSEEDTREASYIDTEQEGETDDPEIVEEDDDFEN